MNIIVFDDDMDFINFINKSFNELNEKYNGIFTVFTYYDANEIMGYVDANKNNASFYILDIMKDNEQIGFLIAEHIKKANENNIIIYVTNCEPVMITNCIAYKMYALAFIFKKSDCFLNELEYAILKIFEESFFIIDSSKILYKLKCKEILYIKKEKRAQKIKIVSVRGDVVVKGTLKEAMSKLNRYFSYAAHDYIVNTIHIIGLDKTQKVLLFSNGTQCPYTRSRKEELISKCQLNPL